MNRRVLFVINSDPRTSRRPAEAIRIAAGVGTWKRAEARVYLRGAAILALGEFTDELLDDDNFRRYLPIFEEWEQPVYVQQGAPELAALGATPVRFEPVNDAELARLVARSTSTLRF